MANIQKIKIYTVDHDYGINPNPFFGYCTMGHCKNDMRKAIARYVFDKNPDGKAGDLGLWVVGIASGENRKYKKDCGGKVLYIMQVTEVLSYKDYWNDKRFINKRRDTLTYDHNNTDFRNCNDNIKEKVAIGCTGKAIKDESEYVLISDNFIYWGNSCSVDLGHEVYGTKTGGGRCRYGRCAEKIPKVVDFINETFGETKHIDILDRPIMSSKDFNLDEAISTSKTINQI